MVVLCLGGQFGSPVAASVWPTCGEASLYVRQSHRGAFGDSGPVDPVEAAKRDARRARTTIRRYVRHNGLPEVITLTFGGVVPALDEVSGILGFFWRRWCRRTGEPVPAYVVVPEWGKRSDRLHLHMAADWWRRLGAVEVCDRCARPALRRVRRDIPPAGSFCIGCLWGHGFVGRPEEDITRPESVAAYCAKYVSKDLEEGGHLRLGAHRFRTAKGYAPEAVKLEGSSFPELYDAVVSMMGGEEPAWRWNSADADDFKGPPTVVLGWDS